MEKMKHFDEIYFHGKRFKTLQELMDYHEKWKDMPLDLIEYRHFLDDQFCIATANKENNPNVTNRMIFSLLREATDWTLEEKETILFYEKD